jgi:hypothetical protein
MHHQTIEARYDRNTGAAKRLPIMSSCFELGCIPV